MPNVPYPYEVNGKLVTGNGSLSNRSLLPSLTVYIFLIIAILWYKNWKVSVLYFLILQQGGNVLKVFCCQGGDARGDDLFPLFAICSVALTRTWKKSRFHLRIIPEVKMRIEERWETFVSQSAKNNLKMSVSEHFKCDWFVSNVY